MTREKIPNAPEGSFDEIALRRAPAKPKVTRPRRCCVSEFWAVVETDGSLVRGRNVTQAQKLATGTYEVLFTHNLSDGVFVATLGRPGIFTEPPGEITLALRAGSNDRGIWINTFNSNGQLEDRAFHLLVLTD
jgi:hypothetical protein